MKTCRGLCWLIAFVVLIVLPGRGQERYTPGPVRNGGTVRGSVTLEGAGIAPNAETVTKDAAWCGKAKPSARLMLGAAGGVKDAVVYIERIGAGKGFPAGDLALLHQKKCEYVPHVLLMTPAMHLEIINDDPILHNVHAYHAGPALKSMFNIAQPVRGQRTRIAVEQLSGADDLFTTCDAGHPWMSAYIIRTPHPYYAVTDAGGRFELKDVPPGTYVLRMWHEGVVPRSARSVAGSPQLVEDPFEQSHPCEVTAGATVTVNFSFTLRAAPR